MKFKINSLGTVVTGATPSKKVENAFGDEIPFLTPSDMGQGKIVKKTNRSLSKNAKAQLGNRICQPPSISISCIGSDMGKVVYNEQEVITNQQINTITNIDQTKFLPQFVYYKLTTLKDYFHAISGGSTMPIINKSSFENILLEIPSLSTQKKVAKILSDLDEKIDNNHNIITNLQKYSEELSKHWFIDFEFPNEQGLPYKSNGGKMVESELGLIPEEFEVINLDQILKVKSQKIDVNKLDVEMNYIGLEHMPRGSVAINNWETSSKVTGAKTLFDKGDILFGKLRPYFKKVGISPIKGVSSTDILVLNSREEDFQYFLLFILSSDAFIDYATQGATGTRMPRADLTHIKKYKIIIPNNLKVLNQFNKVMRPIIEKYTSITLQNIQLQDLRDTLLPKLLSGEIELPIKETVEN